MYQFKREKTYHMWDFILMAFQIAPILTLLKIIQYLLTALMPSFTVLATADFIDTALFIFNGGASKSAIFPPLIVLLFITIYMNISQIISNFINLRLTMKYTISLQNAMIEKRAKLDYQHMENNDTWDLITRTCNNLVNRCQGGFDNIMGVVDIVVQVGSLLIILMTQVWWAGLVILIICIPLFALAIKAGKANYEANKEAEKHLRRADYLKKVLCDRENVEERALFGYTEHVIEKWYERFESARKINLKVNLKYFIRMKGSSLVTVLISICIIGVLLVPLKNGQITAGMFMGLVNGTLNLVQMMSWSLAYTMKELTSNREYLKDLTSFCALSEKGDALELPVEEIEPFESLEFRNVSFCYPGTETFILKNLTCKLVKGRHYAVVGINGAGKTTLTKLLTGLYDNYEGEILLNGKLLRTFSQAQLKRFFAVVYQDFAKYYITMEDNIALGNACKKEGERIQEVIKEIGLSEVVERLPQGTQTYLGKIKEGGLDLSGGEWQRLAIARALYHPAEVRILDEPTAALDPVAESTVYEMFGHISKGKSTIFITHRLGAAKLADEIIVLSEGKVAEQGSHSELMKKQGIYANMFESQRSWYQ